MENPTEDQLKNIIRSLASPVYEVVLPWRRIVETLEEYGNDYGGLELNPDFQRGHVWTEEQKQRFIENVLRGIISSAGMTVQFNCPDFEMLPENKEKRDLPPNFVCIDGLQRITAVIDYVNGKVKPFGYTVDQFKDTSYRISSMSFRFNLAVYSMQTRAEVLQHYLDINEGSTPHSKSEITRIRGLLESARSVTNPTQEPGI